MISCTTSCRRHASTTSSDIPLRSALVALCRQWFDVLLKRIVKKSTSRGLDGSLARRLTLPVRAVNRLPTPRLVARVSICASSSAIDGNCCAAGAFCALDMSHDLVEAGAHELFERVGLGLVTHETDGRRPAQAGDEYSAVDLHDHSGAG